MYRKITSMARLSQFVLNKYTNVRVLRISPDGEFAARRIKEHGYLLFTDGDARSTCPVVGLLNAANTLWGLTPRKIGGICYVHSDCKPIVYDLTSIFGTFEFEDMLQSLGYDV